jgi:urease accessory protein
MLLAESALELSASAHQRVNGAARIEFAVGRDGKTRLSDLYQHAPCRVLFPDTDPGEPTQAVLLTTSGGLTGGDRIQVDFVAHARVRATLTTQAAEKLYRALPGGGDAQIEVRVAVGEEAYAEYLAQETILFDGARLRRQLNADLANDARLLAVESIVFGRSAMNETLRYGLVHDVWRIRRNGRLIFADTLRLDGDIAALRAAPFGFGDAVACGTLIYAANDAPTLLDAVRAALTRHAAVAFATTREGLLILRFLAGDAVVLRHAIGAATGTIRQLAAQLSTRLPQVWYC